MNAYALSNSSFPDRALADPVVITILAVLHVVSAIAWLGSVAFFISSIGPGLKTMTPGANIEFFTKVGARILRFYGVAGTLTIVFGFGLLLEAFGANYAAWPATLEVGFSMGLLAYLFALGVTVPAARRLDRLARQLHKEPAAGPLPAEVVQNLRRLSLGANVVAFLLTLAAVFMVVTGFPL